MLPFDYARPTSLSETFTVLADHTGTARMLSGGTDLIVGLRDGKVRPELVIDLKRVVDLPREIEHTAAGTVIGAGAVMMRVATDPVIAERYPALREAASIVGSVQIRNRATVAGNICTASPAFDTGTPLLLYGAQVMMEGSGGKRTLPLDEFVLGPRRIALGPDEVVTAIVLPAPPTSFGSAFGRMTRRRGVDLATINLSCGVDGDGRTTFAFGAVGPRPFLVVDETGDLADPAATAEAKQHALAALVDQATPITDVRATREYRLAMLAVIGRRLLSTALARRDEPTSDERTP